MGGCRCTYKTCKSATKSSDLHFFHYPVKQHSRCIRWIQLANRLEFMNLPNDQLRNKVICGLHFEDKYFTNDQRKRLVHDAIPTLDAGCFENMSIKDVELLPTTVDGTTFTLQGENFQAPNCGNEKFSFIEEVYTIHPSFIQESFCANKHNVDPLMLVKNLSSSPMEQEDVIFTDLEQTGSQYVEEAESPPKHEVLKVELLSDVRISPPAAPQSNGDTSYSLGGDTNPDLPAISPKNDKSKKVKLKKPMILKTINYHSQEIANIKRSLASTKFSKAKILRSLRGKIPESMYGALSLQLNKSSTDLKPEERSFLHTLHSIAPTAHKTLEDYGWHIPKHEINNGSINIK